MNFENQHNLTPEDEALIKKVIEEAVEEIPEITPVKRSRPAELGEDDNQHPLKSEDEIERSLNPHGFEELK